MFQVFTLRLDIFCRKSQKGKLPKDKGFLTLDGESDISVSNLFAMHYPEEDPYPELALLKRLRLPVGFMQSVMELISSPEDTFWDLIAGCGSLFEAGDNCGWFVVGFENRPKFVSTCKRVYNGVMTPLPGTEKDLILSVLGTSKKKPMGRNPWASLDSSSEDEDQNIVNATEGLVELEDLE